jgi:hypothetical protein
VKRLKPEKSKGREKSLPLLSLVVWENSSRLIPSKYSIPDESILVKVAPAHGRMENVFDLDDATNDRLLADLNKAPGISAHELVVGIPYASIINAAFTHPNPQGARFSGPDRHAWYASKSVKTSIAEVTFHKTVELQEVGWYVNETTYDEYLADFNGEFHDLRPDSRFENYLDPNSYVASQALAERLLALDSMGIVYPSARQSGGECLACFRPALVTNVRKGPTYRFRWDGKPKPTIEQIKP